MTTSISMLYFCAKKNNLLCFKTNTCTSTSTITTSSSSSDRWWSQSQSQSQSQRKMSLVPPHTSNCLSSLAFQSCTRRWRRRRRSRHIFRLLSPNAKKRRRAWWHNILSDNDDVLWSDWSGADDVLSNEYDDAGNEGEEEEEEEEEDDDDEDEELSEADKFESWKRRAEAISELRDAQQSAASAEGRQWEDWLSDGSSSNTGTSSWDPEDGQPVEDDDTYRVLRDDKGLVQSVKNLFMRLNDEDYDDSADSDEFLFEDRVFQYASTSSAKFIALLILIPWALDFLFHDYIFMPFLDRYVKLVPLAAEMLDVRRHQKLEMVNTLKVERARFQLEVEIGRSPPLSDDEIWLELRHKAIELRDEWRLENRRAFANIWSDMVYGISLFILIYSNKGKVALLKFTGYKLINNISDTGKAFLIILITDIFLGYHSESGWQALVEIIVEHYGLQVDPAAITIFICFVPVVIDACVKIWLFKYLPRLSPNVANIFREMKRH